jgi:uncharacterized protein YodC (DUF2158 family)
MTTFKPGDVVMMKMGGPHMTVESIHQNKTDLIRCIWFSRGRKVQRDAFDDFSLKLVEPQP